MLLSDAESGENSAQKIFRGYLSRDLAKRVHGVAKFYREDFRILVASKEVEKRAKLVPGLFHRFL